jgi:hypothetical protein
MSDESQDCYEHVVSHSIRTMKNLLIVDKSVFASSCCVLGGEAANTNFTVSGLT